MIIGIDASNLRAGGTKTHLIELLRAARPADFGIGDVLVWAGSAVLDQIEDRPWLRKQAQPLLEQAANPYRDRRQLHRAYWQRFHLPRLMRAQRCDLLFVPGGMDNSGTRPMVTMSRNMLVFEPSEAARYGCSLARVRLWALRWLQSRTFHRAEGLIFLTEYARSAVLRLVDVDVAKTVVVPHGVSAQFRFAPRLQRSLGECSAAQPFRILYVSTIDIYKHQWHVVNAVRQLRARGIPVVLDLVGPAYPAGLRRLQAELRAEDDFIRCRGSTPHGALCDLYRAADLKVFASSCENMPNILLEAMAAGLPIACSRRGPMPEVLADAGVYFDPDDPDDIRDAIATLLQSAELRERCAAAAFERAKAYSWERCAAETFGFLAQRAAQSRAAFRR
jgi:glycosyltransferase involved in cell wall biosynthesis